MALGWCICQIYHLLVFRGLCALSTCLGLYPHQPPQQVVFLAYTPLPNHVYISQVFSACIFSFHLYFFLLV